MRPTDTGLAMGSKGLVRVVLMFPTLGISEMTIRRAEDQEAVGRGEMSTSEYEQRAADRRAIWSTLLGAAARDSSASATAPWQTDPAYGARRDAYGPGVHMDATGRPYRDDVGGAAPALNPVRPNIFGIDMDATGRRVEPDYDLDDPADRSKDEDEEY